MSQNKRNRFSKEDEETMASVASGNSKTFSMQFWRNVKESLGVLKSHTAYSLKAHWRLINNKTKERDFKTSKEEQKVEKKDYTDWVKSEQNNETFPIQGLTEMQISDFFDKVHRACVRVSGNEIDLEVVLLVLDENKGNIRKTISYFKSMRNNNNI